MIFSISNVVVQSSINSNGAEAIAGSSAALNFEYYCYFFIQELVAKTVVKPHESKEQLRSNRIDKFLTGKYTAIPAFIAIMGLVFFLTFNVR